MSGSGGSSDSDSGGDTPTVEQQMQFRTPEDGDGDVGLEAAEETVGTELDGFGVEVDNSHRAKQPSQTERERATVFGHDDRETTRADEGVAESEQKQLFASADDSQQTLTGEQASNVALFGSAGDGSGSDTTAATDTEGGSEG